MELLQEQQESLDMFSDQANDMINSDKDLILFRDEEEKKLIREFNIVALKMAAVREYNSQKASDD